MLRFRRVSRREFFAAMTPGWVLASAVFFVAVLFLHFAPPHPQSAEKWELCLLQRSAGLPCPLCGGTTASLHLAKGELAPAFRTNPFVATVLLLVSAGALLWLVAGLKLKSTLSPTFVLALGLILLGLNWLYLLLR